jgi:hypothetical protein
LSRLFERNFGCKVVGGASRNTIVFRASDATAPFVTRNVELLELLAPQFEEQLRQYNEEDSDSNPRPLAERALLPKIALLRYMRFTEADLSDQRRSHSSVPRFRFFPMKLQLAFISFSSQCSCLT